MFDFVLCSTYAASAAYSDAYALGNAVAAIVSLISSLISFGVAILSIVAMWMIFEKAGEKGWKALIPLYNSYTMFKIAWKPGAFWGVMGAAAGILLGYILLFVGILSEMYLLVIPAVLLLLAGIIAGIVLSILCNVKLAGAFGQGGGFAVGLIFLGAIFSCILAFDKRITYVGAQN